MLAIGRVLIGQPTLMLLDEPSEGLQPNLVQQIGDDIKRINAELGTTVLFVEQNIELVMNLAQRGYVMDKGQVSAALSGIRGVESGCAHSVSGRLAIAVVSRLGAVLTLVDSRRAREEEPCGRSASRVRITTSSAATSTRSPPSSRARRSRSTPTTPSRARSPDRTTSPPRSSAPTSTRRPGRSTSRAPSRAIPWR